MIPPHEIVILLLYVLMFGSLALLTGSYWLVWRIRKSQHILALSLFITSVTLYMLFMLTKAFNRAYNLDIVNFVDDDWLYAGRVLLLFASTMFFIYTSWKTEAPKK